MKIKDKFVRGRHYSIFLVISLITIGLLFLTASANISPDNVSRTLLPGECYTVTKTVTIPEYTPRADVVFAFDLTGSMSGIINAAKNKAIDVMDNLTTNYPNVSFNFGVMSYMDYPNSYSSCNYSAQYGDLTQDYAYALNQSLTPSSTTVENAINALGLGFGNDGPEAYTRLFYESYADTNVGWRTGSNRLLVNFADNVPHDCDLNQGVPGTSGTWSTGIDPGRDEVIGGGDDLDLQSVLNTMASPPNSITLIEAHRINYNINYWDYWTGITGGNTFIVTSGSFVNDVVNAIVSGITVPSVNDLHLEVTTPGYASWLTSVLPSSYPTVNPGDTVTFNETICAPPDAQCGVHTFTVSAVDEQGVSYGDQVNEITIPCDATPPETMKDHGSNCLYYDESEDVWYMKPDTPIYLNARDNHPDATGVQYLNYTVWWDQDCDGRYETMEETGMVYDNEPNDMNQNTGEIDIELSIGQECCHMLTWYAVDDVGNQEELNVQYYRLDGTPPMITKTHPDSCFFPINESAGIIHVDGRIILETQDYGIDSCIAGVENTFYRYEYDGTSYPLPDEPGAISGSQLETDYGYTEPELTNYWWYAEDDYVEISFEEQCKHTLYYWAKDNACNKGPIHEQTYWVNTCKEEVWIDDSFGYDTLGWWHTHFQSKQMGLDWLGPGGTAYVFEGVYDEDISIDMVPCCDNTGILQMGEYGCFPLDDSALIKGMETIKVDDVTIKYLEYSSNEDASIVIEEGISGVTLRCNKFRQDCNPDAIGVKSYSNSPVNAELNWWGRPTGPNGGKMDDGAIADGFGVQVIGNVDVEPWIGIHAEITQPVWSMISDPFVYATVGDAVMFDASESWAYTYGECCEDAEELPLQYLWDFGDGLSSSNGVTSHVYTEPGLYEVSLMIDAPGIPGLYSNFMYDWANITVMVTDEDEEPLTAQIGSKDMEQLDITMNDPFSFSGSAIGGKPPYQYQWDFGDGLESSEQFPIHVFDSLGSYMVTLTVVDAQGDMAIDSVEVDVVEKQDSPDEEIDEIEIANVKPGFLLSAAITSNEPIQWSIDVEGMIFYGGHAAGTLEGTKTVHLPFSIGFGSVDITISAGDEQRNFEAFMVGPLLLNLHET